MSFTEAVVSHVSQNAMHCCMYMYTIKFWHLCIYIYNANVYKYISSKAKVNVDALVCLCIT